MLRLTKRSSISFGVWLRPRVPDMRVPRNQTLSRERRPPSDQSVGLSSVPSSLPLHRSDRRKWPLEPYHKGGGRCSVRRRVWSVVSPACRDGDRLLTACSESVFSSLSSLNEQPRRTMQTWQQEQLSQEMTSTLGSGCASPV